MRVTEEKVVFQKYYKSLCYFAWTMVNDKVLAEDLVQDAFVSLFQHKVNLLQEDENSIKSFLYTSVRYAVYNLQRKSKTVDKYFSRQEFTEADDVDYEQNIIRAEFLTALYHAVNQLPEACRNVIQLSYVEGLSNQEIADELNLSINTIKTQKQRGIRALKALLNPEFFILLMLLK